MVNPVRVQVSVAAPQSQQRRFSRVPAPLRCGHFAFTPCCDFSAKEKCKTFAPLLVFRAAAKLSRRSFIFLSRCGGSRRQNEVGCFLSVSCGRAARAARTKGCFLSVYSDSVVRAARMNILFSFCGLRRGDTQAFDGTMNGVCIIPIRQRTEAECVFRCGAGRAQMKKRGGVPRFSLW